MEKSYQQAKTPIIRNFDICKKSYQQLPKSYQQVINRFINRLTSYFTDT